MAARWRFYTSLGVLVFATLVCFLAVNTEWSDRAAMVGNNPAEAAEQARFTSELLAIGMLNLLATLLFVIRTGWAWSAVLAIQLGIFAFAQFRGFVTDPDDDLGWVQFSFLPLFTLLVLFAIRLAKESPRGRSIPAGA